LSGVEWSGVGLFKCETRMDAAPACKAWHFVHLRHGTAGAQAQRAAEFSIEPQAEPDVVRFSD
jgi:hypothetical protein